MIAFPQILALAYAFTGLIAAIGYIPTIKDLFRKKMSANISSYVIWSLCAGTTLLYSIVNVHDLLLGIVTGLNFACCTLILGMVSYIKNVPQNPKK